MDIRPCTDEEYDSLAHIILTSDDAWDPAALDHEFKMEDGEYVGLEEDPYVHSKKFDEKGDYMLRENPDLKKTKKKKIITNDADLDQPLKVNHIDFTDAFDNFPLDDMDIFQADFCKYEAWMSNGIYEPISNEEIDIPEATDVVEGIDNTTCTAVESEDDLSSIGSHEEPPELDFEGIDTDDPGGILSPDIFAFVHETKEKEPDYEALRPHFGWAPVDVIKKTLEATTRYARQINDGGYLKKHFKSRFPALNVSRRNEAVATDTIYSDTPAINGGQTRAQIFVGRKTLLTDVYAMKSDSEFVNTLEDTIRQRGAMDILISDSAQVEISKKVLDILRAYRIDDHQSEPHHQHQNFAERRYQTVKRYVNTIMDRTGSPPELWFLCLNYVCKLLNHMSCPTLNGRTPHEAATGQVADISAFLHYHFYEPVYFTDDDYNYPSQSRERLGYWVGTADHVGDALTYLILSEDTGKIIPRSAVRSASSTINPNLRADAAKGEADQSKPIKYIKDRHDMIQLDTSSLPADTQMISFSPDDLIGRTFLSMPNENGERYRVRIARKIEDDEVDTRTKLDDPNSLDPSYDNVKYLLQIDGKEADMIVGYNQVIDQLNKQFNTDYDNDGEQYWTFQSILDHKGPLKPSDPEYNGSKWNVLVHWSTGEKTWEPLNIIGNDDPATCAKYAREKGLLRTPGWKHFRKIGKREKILIRQINQSKRQQTRRAVKYKFGYQVPRTYDEAIEIDRRNGNTKFQDAVKLELQQIDDYDTFEDHGIAEIDKKGRCINGPKGYKRITVHLVFDVKHDGRHKARLVAGGHLTDEPAESVYSSVVSLRSLRIVSFLSELNQLELWGADIGNAYLEAETKEKIYIVAGKEFGERAGHKLVIRKALYGAKTSGKRWHERLSDVLRNEGFSPSKADTDVWMRPAKDKSCYEYIAVYVDDLLMAMKDPKEMCDTLKTKYNFKLKGDGPIDYHIGLNYLRDKDGTLVQQPKKYIEKMITSYEQIFGSKPEKAKSPLEKGDHPEVDQSELIGPDEVKIYLTMIGQLQWLISLGRFDIFSAVTTMSRFRVAPRKGHLERLKRIFGYVMATKHAAIRVRTDIPNYSQYPDQDFDWTRTVYGKVTEQIPDDIPEALGKAVRMTAYVDANLYHDMVTGRALTAVLHLINQTPVDWFCKRQATVETATFGSEFVAARIAVDQIIDLRNTLRYFGVPIDGKTYMFGDNQSVITNSTLPHSQLNKRHNALSYHRVREAVSCKTLLGFYHVTGDKNPADILSKHWGYAQVHTQLQALLFWMGETMDIAKFSDGRKDIPHVHA